MALPGNGTILATSADRKSLYERAAQRIVAMAREFGRLGAGPRPAAPRDRDARGVRQRDDPRHGDGREHEHGAAHPGHRPRGRASRSRCERIDELSQKTPNICKVAPVEHLPHRGRRPGRRHPHDPRRGRPRLPRPARPVLLDGDRQDPGREHRRVRRPGRRRLGAGAKLLTRVRPGGERTTQAWTVAERRGRVALAGRRPGGARLRGGRPGRPGATAATAGRLATTASTRST